MKFTISEKSIFKWLSITIIILTVISILGFISKYFLGHERLFGLIELFNLNGEANIPAFFSTLMLLLSAFLLIIIYKGIAATNKNRKYWMGLIIIFIYLGVDEQIGIHERFNYFFEGFRLPGLFHFPWVIIGGFISLIIAILYFKFVRSLPGRIRNHFFISSIIYIIGALIIEMISALYLRNYGDTFSFQVIANFGEVFEMFGAALFIKTFLRYISMELNSFNFLIGFKKT